MTFMYIDNVKFNILIENKEKNSNNTAFHLRVCIIAIFIPGILIY